MDHRPAPARRPVPFVPVGLAVGTLAAALVGGSGIVPSATTVTAGVASGAPAGNATAHTTPLPVAVLPTAPSGRTAGRTGAREAITDIWSTGGSTLRRV